MFKLLHQALRCTRLQARLVLTTSICVIVFVSINLETSAYAQPNFETAVKSVEQRSLNEWIEIQLDRKNRREELDVARNSFSREVGLKYGSRANSYGPAPFSIEAFVPVRWKIMRTVPYDILWTEMEAMPKGTIPSVALMKLFNIEVQVPRRSFDAPEFSILTLELFNDDESTVTQISTPLHRFEGNKYRLLESTEFLAALTTEIQHLCSLTVERACKPLMELVSMSGFSFNENTVSNWHPYGVHVKYHINFGRIRVHNGSQYGGRPEFIPVSDHMRPFLVD